MEDDRLGVAVVEQVAELFLDVAVVHVHGNGSDLERREHALEVLGAVQEVQRDVIAGADTALCERVREAVHALLGVRVGQPPVAAHERLAIRHRVGDLLPKIGEVVLHRSRT